ncbi:MAG TPA: pilus assembly protein PilM, partial [Patescibacteria group bacterium]|nr:pilus assembly protein PilM [Patescibacteria group bacterium]
YFSGSHQGAQVNRIYLSGGSAALPNVVPTIAETLPLEITFFSPISTMNAEKGVEISGLDMPAYSVAVGLAMGGEA